METKMDTKISELNQFVIDGQRDKVQEAVEELLNNGSPPKKILDEGLISAMTEVGNRFEDGDLFVPEMLISARAMQAGLGILRPYLVELGIKASGKIIIGTIQGDLHDIGKNLVAMMFEGAGFEVIDLGTDVQPTQFVSAVKEHEPNLVGMSALLTTTMVNMKTTIDYLSEQGLRDKVKVIIGGAPITSDYADQIGADGFAADASRAVSVGKLLINN
jgi:5-methyltetrahydrofolate--homocysteine methyltransferase